ncbi:sterile alpha motif domain-containing protein 12 isoform X2 [Xenopus laevis]|uniref:Sterile alpha motif domain-containing protein 12 isoform X2 n=1 Tax=Xenopus laevis TaxID=8355 RepID=A0A8J1KQQ4_XENLA|nr:sterile alpha motif domain-containing protein 12 isoform X2 [Xenopus laevis]XP_041419635.1 sterile alpha motif domain-containing protein 12 isoform X2 [Xenopus laevis]
MAEASQTGGDEDVWEKPVSEWTVQDVCFWFQYGPLQDGAGLVQAAYAHSISGRALLRLTDDLLKRMGIHQENLRRLILLEVLELRLQQELHQLLHMTEGGRVECLTTKSRKGYYKMANSIEKWIPIISCVMTAPHSLQCLATWTK